MKTKPTDKIKNPNIPEARPMTRREWLEFKAAGKDPAFVDAKTPGSLLRIQSEAYDWILTNIYDADALADVPMNELNGLAEKTYWLTYGRGDAEKN